MNHYDRVWATIDLDAIRSNMDHIKEHVNPVTKLIGVIKADGYGHGAVPIAKELEPMEYLFGFATATVEEALVLRKSGIKKPILILGYTFPNCYEEMISEEIRPTVFRLDMAKELSAAAVKIGKNVKVHVKVDTGMTRIGIKPDQSGVFFIDQVHAMPGIEIEGIFTHFAKADEESKEEAKKQIEIHKQFIEKVEQELDMKIPIHHCSNSAGIVELKEANMDIVRAGIILYGLWPSEAVAKDIVLLTPALSLTSCIVFIKEIEKGTPVSYGGTFIAKNNMLVATIPVGYGDGYPRGLSNKGYVLIRGQKAPILGRVCMDQFMVDVTKIEGVEEGDKVTLIGVDGDEMITMELLGNLSGRFNYELACNLSKRIPREYVKNGVVISQKDYFDDWN